MCSMPPPMKLTYFDGKGRAEVTRQLFALADVKFEDIRLTGDSWKEMKAKNTTPFGQLPVLEVDNTFQLCQSKAIEYFVAKRYGFFGEHLKEESEILMISNCVEDAITPLYPLYKLIEDKEACTKIIKEYLTDKFPNYMSNFSKILEKSKSEYIVGSKISVADLKILGYYQFMTTFQIPFDLEAYPLMKKHRERVENEPKLKEYLQNRPVTKF